MEKCEEGYRDDRKDSSPLAMTTDTCYTDVSRNIQPSVVQGDKLPMMETGESKPPQFSCQVEI